MNANENVWLSDRVVVEPLINRWYAWSYLIPPATAARYLTESQIPVLESFCAAPQVHVDALKDPAMMGGPFVQYGADRVDEVRTLLDTTRQQQLALQHLSAAIASLDDLLDEHPPGSPFAELYEQIPAPLRGFIELVYDGRDRAGARFFEGLLYRSEYYRTSNQSIALTRFPDIDQRAFVLSTPRLKADVDLELEIPFCDTRLDPLFAMRCRPRPRGEIQEVLGLDPADNRRLDTLFDTGKEPHTPQRYDGPGLRVRYFGHACVLLETRDVSVLCDPLIAYPNSGVSEVVRYSYDDLPETIDYAVITHNHQDHVMLETLLQLRHKIGELVVPNSQPGSLLDPSLALMLKQLGFANVTSVVAMDEIAIPGGRIISVPVLGEHGDLDIATKNAYWIELAGRRVMLAADSNNLDNALYQHLHLLLGSPDMLFLGMECEGAPYTWTYGPLLSARVSHSQAQSRRLDGSDSNRAMTLVKELNPGAVYIYAMGQEPWLQFITSIDYTDDALPIVESNRLVNLTRSAGISCERLFGCREFVLDARAETRAAPLAIAAQRHTRAAQAKRKSAAPVKAKSPQGSGASNDSAQALTALLEQLNVLGVRLALDGEQLRINAPKGALNDALKAKLKAAKQDIIALLGQRESNADVGAERPSDIGSDEWREDAALAGDLHPQNPSAAVSAVDAKTLMLTGATGFFGAFLLRELLDKTTATIACLVRPRDDDSSERALFQRLSDALANYELSVDDLATRVKPIAGDLSVADLAIAEAERQWLIEHVDCIYHCGAEVHHGLPYEQLKAANVNGTRAIISLACTGRVKPLHFVSTLSVLPPTPPAGKQRMRESDPLTNYPLPSGGYARSKWVAEQMLVEVTRRGLPVSVYRLGPISGDCKNGAFNENDFLYRLFQGYIESGMAPEGALQLDALPADYAAYALVHLSLTGAYGVYHMLHPEPVSSDVVFEAVLRGGYAIERVNYSDWYEHLTRIARDDPNHPLYPLVSLFASRRGIVDTANADLQQVPFDDAATREALADATRQAPDLDIELFSTYLNAMIRAGVVSPPQAQAQAAL